MNSWIEIKVCFHSAPEPFKTKQQLLSLLNINNIQNVVESYFDGVASAEAPEKIEQAIFTGEDHLPVVVYAESHEDAQRIHLLIQKEFKDLLNPVMRMLDETDLGSAWSEGTLFETERFVVCPANNSPNSLEMQVAAGQTRNKYIIKVNPGVAFGNGQHVSTLAVLQSLEKLNLSSKHRVLDLGTGNGVLLIAASILGVSSLIGTDLSPDILDEAQANFRLNQVKAETHLTTLVPVELGPFDLVLVNIPVAGIRPLLSDMLAATTNDALIIMSGFTVSDGQAFTKELAEFGLVLKAQEIVRGWAALQFNKK
jgi:ribosomal protein L11 methylase PrmA